MGTAVKQHDASFTPKDAGKTIGGTEVAESAKNPTGDGGVKFRLYSRPDFAQKEWDIVNRRKHSEFDNPKYDLDENRKWMYAKEKGSTVFAVYSKADAEDPTVLYGTRGKQAESAYAVLSTYLRGELDAKRSGANTNRKSINAILADINRSRRSENDSLSAVEGREPTTGNVQFPLGESGSYGRRDFGDGAENRGTEDITEENTGAGDVTLAPITFSNDYATIRNFMKEGDVEDIAPVGGNSNIQFSLSESRTYAEIEEERQRLHQRERALLDHGNDGNNITQMQHAKEELQNHLINR